mgnify:CR=1 FL=1
MGEKKEKWPWPGFDDPLATAKRIRHFGGVASVKKMVAIFEDNKGKLMLEKDNK